MSIILVFAAVILVSTIVGVAWWKLRHGLRNYCIEEFDFDTV